MISSVLVLLVSFLCHYVNAGRRYRPNSGVAGSKACPRPQEIPFSTVVPLKLNYEPGEQILYVCKPGYVSQWGTRRYTCPLTGMWPTSSMKCLPRVCPFAGILENGAVSYTSFQYPNSVNFTCNKGFYLNGTASAKCMEDGKWNPPLPMCSPITCPPPSIPNFATLKLYKPSVENSSHVQDTAVFDCLPHYAMFGNDTVSCTEHGNWTELPECREVKCPFPTRPDNGFVNYPASPVIYYKDKATYGCHETYVLDGPKEVECGKFGTWSASPTCKASCKIPVKKATVLYKGEKVNIQDKFKNGILHGEIISFFCKNKERKCSYTVDAQCLNGNIEIPTCFKEHSSWAFWKTDAADKEPC